MIIQKILNKEPSFQVQHLIFILFENMKLVIYERNCSHIEIKISFVHEP